MARGDSIIRVSIVGDAKKLIGTLGEVDRKTGGLLKIAGGAFLASRVIDTGFDVIGSGLAKADAFSDALDRISGTVSPEFAKRIEDVAFDMTDIGLSADEVGTLAANFAAFATAAGVSAPALATITPDMLKVAAAIAATTGKTVDEVMEDIGKAAKGSKRPVEEYGFVIDTALNPEQTLLSILEQAKILFPEVGKATDDVAGKQENLAAKFDNLSLKVGEAVEGPLADALDWMIDMAEAAPGAFNALDTLVDKIHELSPASFPNLGSLFDLLGGIITRAGQVERFQVSPGRAPRERDITTALNNYQVRNGLERSLGGP